MANDEQLSILKQGVAVWNKWREDNSLIIPDLSMIDLRELALPGVNFKGVNLEGSDLEGVVLIEADFREAFYYRLVKFGSQLIPDYLISANVRTANFTNANLEKAKFGRNFLSSTKFTGANLREAFLRGAIFGKTVYNGVPYEAALMKGVNLVEADLREAYLADADLSDVDLGLANLEKAHLERANLRRAKLDLANLSQAELIDADLQEAELAVANLNSANLKGANISFAKMGANSLGNIDLSLVIGLETVRHEAPSILGIETLRDSKGAIPEEFLRGCGLSDLEIETTKLYKPDLTNEEIVRIQYKIFDIRATQAIQRASLFISYCHRDKPFVDKLDNALTSKGIRFWRDIHDAKAGRLEKQIDRAMRLNPTVLLILSQHSLESDWVEHEVRTARGLEKEIKKDVLCPVALDDSWKNSTWSKRIMEQIMEYNILDFSEWKDDAKFESTLNKLIAGLGLFYK